MTQRRARKQPSEAHDILNARGTGRTDALEKANEELKAAQAELQRRWQYLAEAQKLSRSGTFGWKVSSGELTWSDETYRILGFAREANPTLDQVFDRIHPEDVDRMREIRERAARNGMDLDFEHRILLPNGVVKYLHAVAHAGRDSSGNLEYMGVVTDITERKRADEERQALSRKLQESNARLEEAQRVAHIGHFHTDLIANRITWSDELYRIYGLIPREGPIDRAMIHQMFHPDDRDRVLRAVEETIRDGANIDVEHRVVRPSGEVRTVQGLGTVKRDASGRAYEIFGTIQDITERTRAEEEREALSRNLQESRTWLEEAQRVAHVGYWVWDVELNQVIWSEETYHIFGLVPQVGSFDIAKVSEAIHPDDRGDVFRAADAAIRSGTRVDCEHRLIRPDGEIRVVHSLGDLKKDSKGRTQMFGTTQDITDRKRAAEERRTLSSALQQSNARLEEAQRVAQMGHFQWDLIANQMIFSSELHRIFESHLLEGPIDTELIREKIHPEDRMHAFQITEDAIRGGTHVDLEYRIVLSNGDVRTLHGLGTVKRDTMGQAYEYFGTTQDITDRKLAEQALRRNQFHLSEGERLAHIGSWASKDLGIRWSEDLDIYWSDEVYNIFGFDPKNGPPSLQQFLAAVHPQDRASLTETMKMLHEQHCNCDVTSRIVRPDGEIRYVRCVGIPVVENEVFQGFHGTTMDVTAQELLTQELRREQAYLAEAQSLTHVGSWACNLATREIFHSSDENARLYGFDPSQGPIPFDRFYGSILSEDERAIRPKLEIAISTGADYDVEFRIRRADGSIRFLRGIGHHNPNLEIGEYSGITMDITERKRAEQEREALSNALQQSNAYLAEAQSLAHIGSWATNFETGEMHHISDETVRLHGFDPKQCPIPLQRFFDTIHPEDAQMVVATLKNAVRTCTDYDIPEFRICLSDGTIRFLRTIGHRDPSGEIGDYIGVTLDITDRKRAEEERERLRQLEAELEHINRVNMMGELAAALAHEIKQPIAASITSANALLRWLSHDPPDLERARATAVRIEEDGNRAADVINSLQSFFRRGTPGKRQSVDLKEIIGEMTVLLRAEADRHSITIDSELHAGTPRILANRVQLQQVLLNLMLNAIEAMKDTGGSLTICTRADEDGRLLVSVIDTGIGLLAESSERIFDPFHTTKPQGTGMGLTITRSIVESYGGRVWASANQGAGATFSFTLPGETEAHV